jgi:hypothetical protein
LAIKPPTSLSLISFSGDSEGNSKGKNRMRTQKTKIGRKTRCLQAGFTILKWEEATGKETGD